METENDSPDELEIVYPTLSRELAPSRACATDDTVPLIDEKIFRLIKLHSAHNVFFCPLVSKRLRKLKSLLRSMHKLQRN